MRLTLACTLLLSILHSSIGFDVNKYEWNNQLSTPENDITLYWKITHSSPSSESTISFAIKAPRTSGWLGMGISPNGGMGHSDLVIGYVDSTTADPVVLDYYNGMQGGAHPVLDEQQDLTDTDVEVTEDGYMILSYTRLLSNCDLTDNDILKGTTRVIWSYGDVVDVNATPITFSLHSNRGSKSLPLFKDKEQMDDTSPETGGDTGIETIDLRVGKENGGVEFSVPSYPAGGWAIEYYEPANEETGQEAFEKVHLTQGGIDTSNVHYKFMHDAPNALDPNYDAIIGMGGGDLETCDWQTLDFCNPAAGPGTVYWWKTFDLSYLTEKKHIIRYEPILNDANIKRTHHLILYECKDDFVYDGIGYSPGAPKAAWDCNFASPVAVWAIGGGSVSFPDVAGFPIGPGYGTNFMIEFHYDSPYGEPPAQDDSGLRLFIQDAQVGERVHDVGMFYTGALLSDFIQIPAQQEKYKINGYCNKECTNEIQDDGIHIYAILLHSHLAGRSLRLQHSRDGIEQEPLAFDQNYDFNLQELQPLDPPKRFYPGDELKLQCTYNTIGRDFVTYGGLGTYDEMCLGYMYYYPRQELTGCLSGYLEDGISYGQCFTQDGNLILDKSFIDPVFPRFTADANPMCPEKLDTDDDDDDDSLLLEGSSSGLGVGLLALGLGVVAGFVIL